MAIVRICDMGCVDNALPVAKALIELGVDTHLFLDPGSIAEEKIKDDYKFVKSIPIGATVLTCMPLGEGFEQIKYAKNPVILIQENPDPADARLKEWDSVNVIKVCTLIKTDVLSKSVKVTGLPSIDRVAEQIKHLNRESVCSKIGLYPDVLTVSLALPGDYQGAKRMLDLAAKATLGKDYCIIARSHPKLKRDDPKGFESISNQIDDLSIVSLEEANEKLSPLDTMALAIGDKNHFVGTHDTTMNWQAAAGAVYNIQVLPPVDDDGNWAENSPIIQSTFGRVFDGQLSLHKPNRSFVTGNAIKDIAEVVIKNS